MTRRVVGLTRFGSALPLQLLSGPVLDCLNKTTSPSSATNRTAAAGSTISQSAKVYEHNLALTRTTDSPSCRPLSYAAIIAVYATAGTTTDCLHWFVSCSAGWYNYVCCSSSHGALNHLIVVTEGALEHRIQLLVLLHHNFLRALLSTPHIDRLISPPASLALPYSPGR